MFYGNTKSIVKPAESVEKLYNNLCVECDNFNSMIESIGILNESGVLLEVDMSKVKERLRSIWEGIKKFVAAIINKITNLIGKKSKEEIKKEVEEKFEESKEDENTSVKVLKPTDTYLNMINSKYFSSVTKYNDSIMDVTDTLVAMAKGKEIDEGKISKEIEALKSCSADLEGLFEEFGGIKNSTSSNEKCFEEVEIDNKEEAVNIKDNCLKIANRNKKLINIVSDSVRDMDFVTGGIFESDEKYNFEYTKNYSALVQNIRDLVTYLYNISASFCTAANYLK